MMVIKQIGSRIIDTEYHSKKFGRVVMDITATEIEKVIDHGTTRYLRKLKSERAQKEEGKK
jgi:hypothetical protein